MKKFFLVIASVFIFAACSQQTVKQDSVDKAKAAYNIMSKADDENRMLTEKEEAKVKKIVMNNPSKLKDREKNYLYRGLTAMYMNFYETSTGDEPVHFNKAKETVEKYIKN